MKIEEKDRLILVNQYRILASLNKKDEKHYQEKIEILENGYEKLYQNLFENFSSEPLSAKDCNFVMDVLEMYGTGITLSFNNLKTKKMFLDGYEEMIKIIEPEKIFIYGREIEELKGNVKYIKPFNIDERIKGGS